MNEEEELSYERGSRAAWNQMLRECLKQLGYDTPEAQAASWITEREASISALRELCAEYGDNNWEEDLHLADVIEKHLGKHL